MCVCVIYYDYFFLNMQFHIFKIKFPIMDKIKIIQFVARQMFCLQVWASVKFITYNNTDKLRGIFIKILYNVPHLHVESHNIVF